MHANSLVFSGPGQHVKASQWQVPITALVTLTLAVVFIVALVAVVIHLGNAV